MPSPGCRGSCSSAPPVSLLSLRVLLCGVYRALCPSKGSAERGGHAHQQHFPAATPWPARAAHVFTVGPESGHVPLEVVPLKSHLFCLYY